MPTGPHFSRECFSSRNAAGASGRRASAPKRGRRGTDKERPMKQIKTFIGNDDGATAIEYALVVALIRRWSPRRATAVSE